MKRVFAILRGRRAARRLLPPAILAATMLVSVAAGSATAARTARSNANVAVSIQDFFFDPTPVTVHVGDTVTWTNDGANYHSATARNGTFDTNPLAPGATGSHTFTKVGTYAYYCEIHPFMHGEVKVVAN
jgi:plastocyanin